MRAAWSLCFVELYSLFILIYYIYYLAFGSSLLRDCRVEAWAFYQEISCSLNLSQPHPWILKQIFTHNLLYFWVLTTNCKYFLVSSNIKMWSRIIIIFFRGNEDLSFLIWRCLLYNVRAIVSYRNDCIFSWFSCYMSYKFWYFFPSFSWCLSFNFLAPYLCLLWYIGVKRVKVRNNALIVVH